MKKVLICSQYFEDWQKHSPNGKLVVKNCEFILENRLNNNQKIDFYIFFWFGRKFKIFKFYK